MMDTFVFCDLHVSVLWIFQVWDGTVLPKLFGMKYS